MYLMHTSELMMPVRACGLYRRSQEGEQHHLYRICSPGAAAVEQDHPLEPAKACAHSHITDPSLSNQWYIGV